MIVESACNIASHGNRVKNNPIGKWCFSGEKIFQFWIFCCHFYIAFNLSIYSCFGIKKSIILRRKVKIQTCNNPLTVFVTHQKMQFLRYDEFHGSMGRPAAQRERSTLQVGTGGGVVASFPVCGRSGPYKAM